jgi:hypothetical protein
VNVRQRNTKASFRMAAFCKSTGGVFEVDLGDISYVNQEAQTVTFQY